MLLRSVEFATISVTVTKTLGANSNEQNCYSLVVSFVHTKPLFSNSNRECFVGVCPRSGNINSCHANTVYRWSDMQIR